MNTIKNSMKATVCSLKTAKFGDVSVHEYIASGLVVKGRLGMKAVDLFTAFPFFSRMLIEKTPS